MRRTFAGYPISRRFELVVLLTIGTWFAGAALVAGVGTLASLIRNPTPKEPTP